jgi:hypothetical protein
MDVASQLLACDITLVHELLEVRPPHTSLSELPSAAAGLRYVCFNAESYERRRIALLAEMILPGRSATSHSRSL